MDQLWVHRTLQHMLQFGNTVESNFCGRPVHWYCRILLVDDRVESRSGILDDMSSAHLGLVDLHRAGYFDGGNMTSLLDMCPPNKLGFSVVL